ncbi:MAG: ABC transporter permease [Dysgonamonadaceae bacterium]|jgi:putative ABC transport system permease protein|nr:ABC transporter permease [Dysgonamonadaceae bacterium]
MFDLDRFQEIWNTITRNRVRSFLTAFGVFWGIFMLMAMLGAGHGLERGMWEELEGIATNSCFMGSGRTSIAYKGFQKGRYWNIRNADIDILEHSIPEIDDISPLLFGGRMDNNTVYEENTSTASIKGVKSNYQKIEKQTLSLGRFINELDVVQARKVCVIGEKIYEELFPTKRNPMGLYVRVRGIYFQVVGVTKGVSSISLNGKSEESVFVPITTMQKLNNEGDVIHMLAATAKPNVKVSDMEKKMKDLLKAVHSVAPDDEQAMWGFNLEETFNVFKYLFLGIATLIWIVGSGTLLAGIIGVSNIMVVTVKERTREIGVRRALGAKPRTILGQIVMETLTLILIAGLLGICFGVLVLQLADVLWLQKAENMFLSSPVISFWTAVTSTFILLAAGLVAGLLPAVRALQIKAIDAIRDE